MNDHYMMSILPAITEKLERTPDLRWTNQIFSLDNLEMDLRAGELWQRAETQPCECRGCGCAFHVLQRSGRSTSADRGEVGALRRMERGLCGLVPTWGPGDSPEPYNKFLFSASLESFEFYLQ